MVSKRGNSMKRFEGLLGTLPAGCILDGEIVALDEAGRPKFKDLIFARRPPVYLGFDVVTADGDDLRLLPLRDRKAVLARLADDARGWLAPTDGVVGEGRRSYSATLPVSSTS
jgi:bifunctional non-homologous end joining protein LigD